MMKTQKLLITLAVANAALLLFLLTHPHGTVSQDVAPVIRGRAHQVRRHSPISRCLTAQRISGDRAVTPCFLGGPPVIKTVDKDGREKTIRP
jgi:hypothetical protein